MFVSEPGQPNPQFGQFLGEQEVGSRLDGDDYIAELSPEGPRIMGTRLKKGKFVVKCADFH